VICIRIEHRWTSLQGMVTAIVLDELAMKAINTLVALLHTPFVMLTSTAKFIHCGRSCNQVVRDLIALGK
jgi:hypothetical protein